VNPAEAWLTDPVHPVCCDTSALYYPGVLRRLRQRFPGRRIVLPAVAYFERQRQLRIRFGPAYRSEVLRQNLLEPLEIEIIPCEEPIALFLAQVVEQIETRALSDLTGNQVWPDRWTRREAIRTYGRDMRARSANWVPLLRGEPDLPGSCGQRCRLSDYVVAATARLHDALLLTTDRALLDASDRHSDLFPPALSPQDCWHES